MLPFAYAVRNLFRGKTRLLQTIGGSALVVLLVMAAVAINHGMNSVLSASGCPHNVILVAAGSEESTQRSEVQESSAQIAASAIPGLAERLGLRAVSSEIHFMTYVGLPGGKNVQALLRGVSPEALLVYPRVRLTDGEFPVSGEIMVGRLAWRQLGLGEDTLKPGTSLAIDGQSFRISGIFAAPGTVLESELWATLGDLRVLSKRETLSCVVLRFVNPVDFEEADLFTKQRFDLELSAIRETDYYRSLGLFFQPLRAMTWITAVLIGTGALFGGINTLYAAFASRIREMATLQAIGFGRRALLLSLIQESTLASLCGTLLAALVAMLLLDGRTVPFSIGSFALEIGPAVAMAGIGTGLFLGFIGALPAAIRCLKPSLPSALRMS